MGRVTRWLGWTVALSLVPYLAIACMRITDTGTWPGFFPLIGGGRP